MTEGETSQYCMHGVFSMHPCEKPGRWKMPDHQHQPYNKVMWDWLWCDEHKIDGDICVTGQEPLTP